MTELFSPQRVRKLGSIRHFKTPSGSHVIVLPTCTVPLEYLVEENWDRKKVQVGWGNMRRITRVKGLNNGIKVDLFVKDPERRFKVRRFGILRKLRSPWTYKDVNKRKSLSKVHLGVEKQAVREARILMGLKYSGLKAEEPQAIVIQRDGTRELIVKTIQFGEVGVSHEKEKRLNKLVRSKGFKPNDLTERNIVQDENGNDQHIIDVNRWEWPPVTDKYKRMLLKALDEEIKLRKKAKK